MYDIPLLNKLHIKVPSTSIKLRLFLLNLNTKATVELIGNMVECVSEVQHWLTLAQDITVDAPPTTVNKLTASVVIKASNIWANLLLQMSYPVFMTNLQDEQNSHPIQKQSSGKKRRKKTLFLLLQNIWKDSWLFPFLSCSCYWMIDKRILKRV